MGVLKERINARIADIEKKSWELTRFLGIILIFVVFRPFVYICNCDIVFVHNYLTVM